MYEARYAAEEALYEQVVSQLTPDDCARLDALCQTEGAPSLLVKLAAPPRQASAEAIKQQCDHLEVIRANLPSPLDWGAMTHNRLRQWAAAIARLKTQEVRNYPSAKRYTLLCAFLVVRAEEITNVIVEMFDELVGKVFSRSDTDLEQTRLAHSQAHQESARLFKKVAQVLLDPEIPEDQVRDEVFKQVPRERVSALVNLSEAMEQNDAEALFDILDKRWPHLRDFAPRVLSTLSFGSPRANNTVLEALRMLTDMNSKGQRTLPEEAPIDFVPKKWSKVVNTREGVDKHAWEFSLMHEMRAGNRSGTPSLCCLGQ